MRSSGTIQPSALIRCYRIRARSLLQRLRLLFSWTVSAMDGYPSPAVAETGGVAEAKCLLRARFPTDRGLDTAKEL